MLLTYDSFNCILHINLTVGYMHAYIFVDSFPRQSQLQSLGLIDDFTDAFTVDSNEFPHKSRVHFHVYNGINVYR